MPILKGVFDPLRRQWNKLHRRILTGYPTTSPPEANDAYREQVFRYYATSQPYVSPHSMPFGNPTGETTEMRKAYREWALAEDSVKPALMTKCLQVCQLDMVVRPGGKSDRAKQAAEWVKYAINEKAEGGAPGLLFNFVFNGCVDGFSLVEKVNATISQPSSPYNGFWYHSAYASIDTQFIAFRLDTFRHITAVRSNTGAQGGVALDPRDFAIFTHMKIFENPFGVSDLRAVVRPVRIIEAAIRLRTILLTNYSGPYIVAKSRDAGTRNTFLSILANARANGFLVCDKDDEIEVVNLATSSVSQFDDGIMDARKQVVGAINGAYLHLMEGGQNNELGNTQVHKDISQLFVWWLAIWVSQTINRQIVPDLVIPNYGYDVEMPIVSLGGVDAAVILQALDKFQKANQLVDISADQVREECNLEVPKDEMDKIKAAWSRGGQGQNGDMGNPFMGDRPVTRNNGGNADTGESFRELFAGLSQTDF